MLKKGYNIVCESYENDGDYENTIAVFVDTLKEAKFYLEWLNLFKSVYDDNQVSNLYCSFGNTTYLKNKTIELIKKHGHHFTNGRKEFTLEELESYDEETFAEICQDVVTDFVGYSEHYGFRVVEEVKVLYLESDVEDITHTL